MSDQKTQCTSTGCDNPQHYDVGPYGKCGECHHQQMIDCQWDHETSTYNDEE